MDATSWVRHVADLSKCEKTRYLHLLPTRFRKVKPYLSIVKAFSNLLPCNNLINHLKPAVVLVDDKLYQHVSYPRKVRESRAREKHRKKLILLADNVAYYTYWCVAILGRPEKIKELDC